MTGMKTELGRLTDELERVVEAGEEKEVELANLKTQLAEADKTIVDKTASLKALSTELAGM